MHVVFRAAFRYGKTDAKRLAYQATPSTSAFTSRLAAVLPGHIDAAKAVEAAKKVGLAIAERAKAKGIATVVFDRSGYIFHGRVAELAEGAREGGLEF